MTYENDFKQLAYLAVQMIEGGDYLLDDFYTLLNKHKFVDEDGFWIYEEDE